VGSDLSAFDPTDRWPDQLWIVTTFRSPVTRRIHPVAYRNEKTPAGMDKLVLKFSHPAGFATDPEAETEAAVLLTALQATMPDARIIREADMPAVEQERRHANAQRRQSAKRP
jgi:hypothetical protein